MKKLTMTTLLETIKECISPVGAAYLSKQLDASVATIGRMLKQAEENGYITSISNKGRIITPKGETFLESQMTQVELLQNAEEVIALAFIFTSSLSDVNIPSCSTWSSILVSMRYSCFGVRSPFQGRWTTPRPSR